MCEQGIKEKLQTHASSQRPPPGSKGPKLPVPTKANSTLWTGGTDARAVTYSIWRETCDGDSGDKTCTNVGENLIIPGENRISVGENQLAGSNKKRRRGQQVHSLLSFSPSPALLQGVSRVRRSSSSWSITGWNQWELTICAPNKQKKNDKRAGRR
ncbi:hypothetical protein Pmani_012540 [Petrolisthes manimaculis]|uniref:Uncharacterized protein n=1 Tax=Petrolisthes manimaculis TaxID=1843537 RepID=A0AAE1PWU2_9EUCA|nr:hypothetical protein Pmani_012540 [Petrolisthes manimaculis]